LQPRPTKGKMRIHCLENVDKALTFLREQRVHLENMGSHDIVDGSPRLTLGLIWTIILRFQVPNYIRESIMFFSCLFPFTSHHPSLSTSFIYFNIPASLTLWLMDIHIASYCCGSPPHPWRSLLFRLLQRCALQLEGNWAHRSPSLSFLVYLCGSVSITHFFALYLPTIHPNQ